MDDYQRDDDDDRCFACGCPTHAPVRTSRKPPHVRLCESCYQIEGKWSERLEQDWSRQYEYPEGPKLDWDREEKEMMEEIEAEIEAEPSDRSEMQLSIGKRRAQIIALGIIGTVLLVGCYFVLTMYSIPETEQKEAACVNFNKGDPNVIWVECFDPGNGPTSATLLQYAMSMPIIIVGIWAYIGLRLLRRPKVSW